VPTAENFLTEQNVCACVLMKYRSIMLTGN